MFSSKKKCGRVRSQPNANPPRLFVRLVLFFCTCALRITLFAITGNSALFSSTQFEPFQPTRGLAESYRMSLHKCGSGQKCWRTEVIAWVSQKKVTDFELHAVNPFRGKLGMWWRHLQEILSIKSQRARDTRVRVETNFNGLCSATHSAINRFTDCKCINAFEKQLRGL
jgi:hypothetical protein